VTDCDVSNYYHINPDLSNYDYSKILKLPAELFEARSLVPQPVTVGQCLEKGDDVVDFGIG